MDLDHIRLGMVGPAASGFRSQSSSASTPDRTKGDSDSGQPPGLRVHDLSR